MNTQNQESNLKDRILSDIRAGHVAMRPRFYHILKITALIFCAIVTLVVSVFILNFILFSIRINSQDILLGFGPRGWSAFLMFFPWYLLIFDIGLILLLEWLMRRFQFGYKIPILYLLAALFVATTATAFIVDRGTPFNDRLFERAHHLPPPLGGFYEGARHAPPPGSGICRCTITSIDNEVLMVEDTRDGTSSLTIILPFNNPRATSTNLHVGDIIFIAGEEKDGIIQAFGVHKEGENSFLPPNKGI